MAESAKTAEAAKDPKQEAAPPARKRSMVTTLSLVGGIMILEAIGLFVVFKFFGDEPHPVEAGDESTSKPWEKQAEVPLAEIRALNTSNGRAVYYRLKVGMVVQAADLENVQKILDKKKLTVEDLIGRTIREAEERELTEPGLDTLKRRLRLEVGAILGDEKLVEYILIPECMPLPSGM